MIRMNGIAGPAALGCVFIALAGLTGGCVTQEKLDTAIAQTRGQLQGEIEEVRTQAQASADEVEALRARVEALNEIPARLDDIETKIADLNAKVAELEELKALETRMSDAEAALGRHETAVGSTREAVDRNSTRIDQLDKLVPLLATKDAMAKYSQETDAQLALLDKNDQEVQAAITRIQKFVESVTVDLENLKHLFRRIDLATKDAAEEVQAAIDQQNTQLTRDRMALIEVMEAQAQTLADQTEKLKTAVQTLRGVVPAPATAPTPQPE